MKKPKKSSALETKPKQASTQAWRQGAKWEITAPGCWIDIEGSVFGTVIRVYANEDRFTDQPCMVAKVEVVGQSGRVRKFRNQARIEIIIKAKEEQT